jgi:hypothetical protein
MCLIKDKKHHPFNRPLIAGEDIVCYKVLTQNAWDSPDILRTPYQYQKIRIQVYLDYQIPFTAWDEHEFRSFWRHKLGFSRVVESGFIHTYRDNHFIPLYKREWVFKCIIPKGTEYFIGIDNDYASERIIFLERLT